MEPTTAAVVGAGISAVGGAATQVGAGLFGKEKAYKYNSRLQREQAAYNRSAQARAFEQNMELSKYAYDRQLQQWRRENQANLDFWHMQNNYNTPAAQMSRYQAAGLNPNLIYGQSNTADQVTAASSPNFDATPVQAEQMSGGSGVGDDLRATLGDPLKEYYQILQMQQSLENSKLQGQLIESQTNKNNMDALFGETRNEFLRSSEEYWKSNAQFDNVAKKIQNDISSANLSAILFNNQNLLPLKLKEVELLNSLRSQNLEFNKEANPLKIKDLTKRLTYQDLRNELLQLDVNWEKAPKNYIESGEFSDSLLRRTFIEFLRGLTK